MRVSRSGLRREHLRRIIRHQLSFSKRTPQKCSLHRFHGHRPIIAINVADEIKDIKFCELSQRRKPPAEVRWVRLLWLKRFFRQFVLIPIFVDTVVSIIISHGSDSISVCTNAVALTFILQFDNLIYATFLSHKTKVYFEKNEAIKDVMPEETKELHFLKHLYVILVFITIFGALVELVLVHNFDNSSWPPNASYVLLVWFAIIGAALSWLVVWVCAPLIIGLHTFTKEAKFAESDGVDLTESPRVGWNSLKSLIKISLRANLFTAKIQLIEIALSSIMSLVSMEYNSSFFFNFPGVTFSYIGYDSIGFRVTSNFYEGDGHLLEELGCDENTVCLAYFFPLWWQEDDNPDSQVQTKSFLELIQKCVIFWYQWILVPTILFLITKERVIPCISALLRRLRRRRGQATAEDEDEDEDVDGDEGKKEKKQKKKKKKKEEGGERETSSGDEIIVKSERQHQHLL